MCFLTWSPKGTPSGRLLFQLAPSTRHTDATEFGSSPTYGAKAGQRIPTPTASDHIERESNSKEKLNFQTNKSVSLDRFAKMWPTPTQSNDRKPDPKAGGTREGGAYAQVRLQDAVDQRMWPTPRASVAMGEELSAVKARGKDSSRLEERVAMWATPQARDYRSGKRVNSKSPFKMLNEEVLANPVKLFPTPAARDYKGARKPETRIKAGRSEMNSLPDSTEFQGNVGRLNPEWVTWLMGYPKGWLHIGTKNPPTSHEFPGELEKESKN